MRDKRIIQVLGPRVRSGTNFLSNFLNVHPQISVIPSNNTRVETPWLSHLSDFEKAWDSFNENFSKRFFFRLPSELNYKNYCSYMSTAFIEYLCHAYDYDKDAKYLLLKNPSFENLNKFFLAFPNGKLILIIRDGRDNIASSMKAYIRLSNNEITFKRIKKYINRWSYREFYLSALYWKKNIHLYFEFKHSKEYDQFRDGLLVLKYEDLVKQPELEAKKIFDFLELDLPNKVLDDISNLKVVGSSFYGLNRDENADKPNWKEEVPKNSQFQPVGRWKNWSIIKRWIFKKIAGKELILLGYESDNNW